MSFVRCLTKIDKLRQLKFSFCWVVFYFPAVSGIAIKHCFCIMHEACRRKVHIQPEKPCWSALPTVQEVKYTPTQVQDPKMKMKGVFSQRKTCQNLSCISVWTQQLQRRRSSFYIRRLNVIMSKTKYFMFHCPLWPPRQKPHSKQFSWVLVIPYHLGQLPLDVFGAALLISVVFYDFGMDRSLCSLVLSLSESKWNNVAHMCTWASWRRELYICWHQQLISMETYELQVCQTQTQWLEQSLAAAAKEANCTN